MCGDKPDDRQADPQRAERESETQQRGPRRMAIEPDLTPRPLVNQAQADDGAAKEAECLDPPLARETADASQSVDLADQWTYDRRRNDEGNDGGGAKQYDAPRRV